MSTPDWMSDAPPMTDLARLTGLTDYEIERALAAAYLPARAWRAAWQSVHCDHVATVTMPVVIEDRRLCGPEPRALPLPDMWQAPRCVTCGAVVHTPTAPEETTP